MAGRNPAGSRTSRSTTRRSETRSSKTGGGVATYDLARRARELLSMTGGSASRSLNQLVGLVSRQVPGCSGATSAVWREDEPVARAASHPDLAELFELQL